MKRLLIAILIVSMVQGVFAQKIEIKGTIRNATDNEATEFVNVVLQTTDSVFVNGVSTNNNGSFIFNKVEAGNYRLVLSCVGYNTQYITLNGAKRNTDLGDIFLEDASVALEGVIINGSNQINRPDRKLVFPSERQMKVSTNGVNLLQELMLPRIQVNPMNNEIGISGGGELQIRINGVKADINEIKALRPADIIRIEYHDNPGLRYDALLGSHARQRGGLPCGGEFPHLHRTGGVPLHGGNQLPQFALAFRHQDGGQAHGETAAP